MVCLLRRSYGLGERYLVLLRDDPEKQKSSGLPAGFRKEIGRCECLDSSYCSYSPPRVHFSIDPEGTSSRALVKHVDTRKRKKK